ncbi:MAG TPA: Flp pilus assembly protein CpaB [Nocardioidaceae bacterium]|nr:Flp pilus assembly protein CpaB [Nocardioidaceae bacterium]
MGRRTVLLVAAALIAVLGSAMVFLYVRSIERDSIKELEPVQVLKATAQIEPGETANAAMTAGKLQLESVPRSEILLGAVGSVSTIGTQVALATIYPGEQIISSKFGAPGSQSLLTIPDKQVAVSISLSDTGRVAGFVSPGSEVAVFATCGEQTHTLFDKLTIIAVGATTVTNTTTTQGGTATTEQLPRTLFTLAVDQKQAQKLIQASSTCELAYGLRTKTSAVSFPFPPANPGNLFTR